MFCPNCGKTSMEGAKFCENCGTALPTGSAPSQPSAQAPPQYQAQPQYQSQPYSAPPQYGQPVYATVPLKSAGLAAVLALIIPGLGHIYLGKIGDGIVYLVLSVVLGALFFLIVPLIILLILWIWQIFDAYNKANQYNAAVQQTGRAPW